VDIACIEIGRSNRHDRGGDKRPDSDGREGDADEPRWEAMEEQRRHREVVAELPEASRIFGNSR